MTNILPNTGQVNLAWPSASNIEGYSVDIISNNFLLDTIRTTGTNYIASGLFEGDIVIGEVHTILGGRVSNVLYHRTSEQTVDRYNFNDDNTGLFFDSLLLNESTFPLYNSSIDSDIIYANEFNRVRLNVKSPRDNEIINTFADEPFFSGLTYQLYNNSGTFASGSLDSFSFVFNDSFNQPSLTGKFIAYDFHGGSTTGLSSFKVQPTEISSISIISNSGNSVNVQPVYKRSPFAVNYYLYSGLNDVDAFFSGSSSSPNNFSFSAPSGTSGYLGIDFVDWNESTPEYRSPQILNPNFIQAPDLEPQNSILYFAVSSTDSGIFNIESSRSNLNSSGSFFKLSIDSDSGSSFDSNSYYTGQFNEDFTLDFDYFNNRTGNHEDFYFNLELYKSGSLIQEDSSLFIEKVPQNQFNDIQFKYNYASGYAYFDINSTPDYFFSGIDILYSGNNYTGYEFYSGEEIHCEYSNPEFNIKMVSTDSSATIYEKSFTGRAATPQVKFKDVPFQVPEGTVNFGISNATAINNINHVRVYKKPAVVLLEGDLGPHVSSGLNFNDYEEYPYTEEPVDFYSSFPPLDITETANYQTTGVGYTGTYASGRFYLYKIVPENGFGTGIGAEGSYDFPSNTLTFLEHTKQAESAVQLDQTVSDVSTVESNVSAIESNVGTIEYAVSRLLEDSVYITGTQFISGEKHFQSSIFITGNGENIYCNEPTTGLHAVNKDYLESTISGLQSEINYLQSELLLLKSIVIPTPTTTITPSITVTPTVTITPSKP